MRLKHYLTVVLLILLGFEVNSQVVLDYANPRTYVLGGVTVSGIKYLDEAILIQLSGLKVGDEISVPGQEISDALQKLWRHGLFGDVKISATKIDGNNIFLDIYLLERPRLLSFNLHGIKKAEMEAVEELINLRRGGQITDNLLNQTVHKIKEHYYAKGFYNIDIDIVQKDDSLMQNTAVLDIYIEKGKKVRVKELNIQGNTVFPYGKLNRIMKKTHAKIIRNVFRSKKFVEDDYVTDKKAVIAKYQTLGYRDAFIEKDSVYFNAGNETVNIDLVINEGKQYYFRNITWVGNTKYSAAELNKVLKISRGDVYNQELLDKRLVYDMDAVGNLYLDDGYLFYNCTPVELNIEGDSIDLEMRIYEGQQATINRVILSGNTRTNEHVARRELYSRPGELFSKTAIQRSIRELAQLGHFDAESMDVVPYPNPDNGTVDVEYILTERPNDQIEVSGGWGGGMLVGTVGLRFNNFAISRVLDKDAWKPVPTGDGQQFSIRVQSNGKRYQTYNFSFVEPWLGGKKPNSLTVSAYHSRMSNNVPETPQFIDKHYHLYITGAAVGLGKRLKWPDDYFSLYSELSFQNYNNVNYPRLGVYDEDGKLVTLKNSRNLGLNFVFARNSIDFPLYPRRGSSFSLGLQVTPPYSLISGKDYADMDIQEKFEWLEYHKWTFKAEWYNSIIDKLVLFSRFQMGYVGHFNDDIGAPPYQGYDMGGDAISYNMYGSEIIPLRGYKSQAITPTQSANMYNKFTFELRYPIVMNETTTVYALAFAEGGNAWKDFQNYTPFQMYRSAGVGLRIFLPMLGLMGIDWGYGFDPTSGSTDEYGGQFHFILGQQF